MFAILVGFLVANELVMDSAYVDFFGIQPDSGATDPDGDGLSNYEESLLWTDPFVADTDRSGFSDSIADTPVSRAFIPWGSPFFTHPDGSVLYTWPLWMQAAWADGGLWLTNIPYGWHSPAAETNPAALHMEIDRAGVESNLVLSIEYLDHANSTLYLDLFDTNDTITASALYGNLLSGSGTETNRILEIPFAANPAATGIRLRKGAGDITIYDSLLYVDADLDGLDADQEAQLGTSDFLADSDGDGLSDYDEVFIHGTDPANPDTDGDGIGDGIELRMGLDPLVAGNYSALPFTETFEPPAITTGELSGQNNWEVNLPGVAIVQTNEVFAGLQALKLANEAETNGTPVIRHLFANAPSVVWMDFRQQVITAAIPTNMPDAAAFLLFDTDGHLVVSDGNRPAGQQFVTLTNAPAVAQGEWVRITIRADYAAQTWLVCLNGVLVAENLGFATPQERFALIEIEGQSAVIDNIYVGASQPDDLATTPGNQIPDYWYLLHFGSVGSDAADPDADGLTNLQEYHLGTNPNNPDTDGDGISDAYELQLGRNPLVPDTLSMLPFTEGFEPPAISIGELSGQNNWIANRPGMALVQTNEVLGGIQALKLLNEADDEPVSVNQVFVNAPSVVWVDIHQQALAAALPESTGEATAFVFFNGDGHLVVFDGLRPQGQQWITLTNAPAIPQGEWARITVRADYTAQTWLVCLNGVLAAENLGFASPRTRLESIRFEGQAAVMDDIYVGPNQPAGIATVPGNQIPDEWYIQHFGSLGASDADDPDADDLTNLQEYLAGTNPNNPDTDGDGFADSHEFAAGSDPLDPLSYPITLSGTITYTGSQTGSLHIAALSASGDRHLTLATTGQGTAYALTNLVARNDYTITAFLDTTANGTQYPWEPTGAYPANPILEPVASLANIDITLTEDTQGDTDGDGISDYDEVYTYGADPLTFTTTPGNATVLTRQVWLDIPGTTVAELTNDPRYPYLPNQENVLTELFEAPTSAGDYYGQRILGRFLAPQTGYYTFWIASDDYGQLWITDTNSTRQLVASVPGWTSPRQWDKFPIQQASRIHLEAGTTYVVEALMKEHGGGDNLAVGILFPDGRLERPMRARWFTAPPPEVDVLADTDGDELTDYEEWVYGTDPANPDTDYDGFDDKWELMYGFDPLTTTSGTLDPDGDGLDNATEYAYGTNPLDPDTDGDGLSDSFELSFQPSSLNPLSADTDGDGLSDGMEVNVYLTSPLMTDSDTNGVPDGVLLTTLAGTNTSRRTGGWAENGSILYATTNVGQRLEYEIAITNAGMFALNIGVTNTTPGATACKFRMQLLVDGVRAGWIDISRADTSAATGFINTPWLIPGTHTIRLAWLDDNAAVKNLGIESLKLYQVDAPDTDANGRQDWVDAILATGVDTDGDGLSDSFELSFQPSSLNPLSVDTDGDGLTDGDELNSFATDPLNADSNANGISDATRVSILNGADASFFQRIDATYGTWWYVEGSELYSPAGDAYAYYEMTVTNAGMYLVGIQIRNLDDDQADDYLFGINMSINGHHVGSCQIAADLDLSGFKYMPTAWLDEGTHTISFAWTNGTWWGAGPKDPDIVIQAVSLYSVDGPDSNTNGIQDWVEAAFANAGDTDTDGDGISDADEVLIYGTSPVNTDTDGDGLSDYAEVFIHGTDPNNADSDGDGISDGEEINEALTDPLTAEFDGTVTTVDTVYGSQTNTALGSWKVEGTEIIAKYARGYVEYTLTAPTNDSYRILIEATHDWLRMTCSPVSPIDSSNLEIYLDGQYLGTKKLVAPDGIYGDVRIFTPYIAPGEHTIRIYWENVHTRIALRIKQLHLQTLGGPDSDNDGVKDWVEASIGNTTGLDASFMTTNAAGAFVSVVSPACLEGPVHYIDLMSCTIGTNNVPVNHGAGDSWYLDADLSATGPTAINLSFLDDAVSVVTNVTWVPLDLLTADDMRIRKNDSVMFNVQPAGQTNGTVDIAITLGATPVTNITTTLDQPVAYCFNAAGNYTVTGSFSNETVTTSGSMTVAVIAGSFPPNPPSCLIGTQRTWACPDMPNGVTIEADNTVDLTFTNGVTTLTMWKVDQAHHAVARISPNGPILASTELVPLWAQGAVDSYMWVTERYEDSALWQNRLIFKNLPDNVDIRINIVTGGITLDDSTLERWITSADLDELGQYDLGIIVPTGINTDGCHTVKLYQNGVYLGEAYYGGILMPNE